MATVFVTGAAGFIGSNSVDRLLQNGCSVIGWDNFSTGFERFLTPARKHPGFKFIQGDNLDLTSLKNAMQGADSVWHLAANADVRFGLDHPARDLEQNTLATFNVLEAMRANEIRKIVFSSTGSIYGESPVIPTPEDAPFPIQTSLYGASKLACEGLIQAYSEGYGLEASIFRFVSILGQRYTHGHIFDFYRQLLEHPDRLKVLGNGKQRKSYLEISDCVDAILHVTSLPTWISPNPKVRIVNLGTNEYCEVTSSIGWISEELGLKPKIEFTGGDRGWVGDNPFIFLDTAKVNATGWKPRYSIREGVLKTLGWLRENKWVLEQRK